jgi:alpha-L-fucosidase 2
MLAWESLSDFVEAAKILDFEDDPLVQKVQEILPNLAQPRIAKDGRLEEWRVPTYCGEPAPGHRHISHAYGFFPGHQYNQLEDPEKVAAIRKSIDYRLDHKGGQTGWSQAWLICLRAVFQQPEQAYENLRGLIVGHLNSNLFDLIGSPRARSPFQIDANMGYVAGVATMLVQSHVLLPSGERVIQILPALPAAWPKGSVCRLHTRGGLEVEMQWTPGVVELTLHATRAGHFRIQCLEQEKAIVVQPGQTIELKFQRLEK